MRITVILLSALIWAPLAQAGTEAVERHFQTGLKMAEQGRFKDAAVELKVAAALAPERADIKEALAKAQAGEKPVLGEAKEPQAKPESGPQAGPEKGRAEEPLKEAREAYRQSDLNRAQDAWNRALLLDKDNAEAKTGLEQLKGESYKVDKDAPFDSAVKDLYEAALREVRKERFVEGRKKLEEALSLNPAQAQVKATLSKIEKGAVEQAQKLKTEIFDKAGELALEAKDWIKARESFQAALDLVPSEARAREGLRQVKEKGSAEISELLAKAAKAAQEESLWLYKKSLAIDPDNGAAQKGLKQAEAALKKNKASQGLKEKVKAVYNEGVEAWQQGNLSLAATRFKETLALAPEDQDAARALKMVESKLASQADKAQAEAKGIFEEARQAEQKGKLEEALSLYERAAARDPQLKEAGEKAARLKKEISGK